jgi:hypothetical protein
VLAQEPSGKCQSNNNNNNNNKNNNNNNNNNNNKSISYGARLNKANKQITGKH